MGWEDDREPEPEPEPHWSELPPEPDESRPRRVARAAWRAGFYVLSWIDYIGEWFAAELGITTPKYQYVIDELADMQDEVKEEQRAEQEAFEEARRIEAEAAAKVEEGDLADTESTLESSANAVGPSLSGSNEARQSSPTNVQEGILASAHSAGAFNQEITEV